MSDKMRRLEKVRISDVVDQLVPTFEAGLRTARGESVGVQVNQCTVWVRREDGGLAWAVTNASGDVTHDGHASRLRRALHDAVTRVCVQRPTGAAARRKGGRFRR